MKTELDFRDSEQSDFKAIRIYPETNAETGQLQFIADYLKVSEIMIISDMHNWHLLVKLEEADD